MEYIFSPDNWEWLWSGNNLQFFLEGFLINLEIAAIGIVFSLIFGLLLALMRISSSRLLSIPAGIWVDLWRNLPLILIILYFGLAVPSSWRQAWGDNIPGWFPEALQDELVLGAILGLVLYNSAVLCEIMRSGILSLDRGQHEAAASLGLTYRPADAVRDPAAGPPPDGAGHRFAADHAEQGHDAGQILGITEVLAPRQQPELRHVLRRGAGTAPAGLPDDRFPLLRRQLRPLTPLPAARDPRAKAHRDEAPPRRGLEDQVAAETDLAGPPR